MSTSYINAREKAEKVIFSESDPEFQWNSKILRERIQKAYDVKYSLLYLRGILVCFTSNYYTSPTSIQQHKLLRRVDTDEFLRVREADSQRKGQVLRAIRPSLGTTPLVKPGVYTGPGDEKGVAAMRKSKTRRWKHKEFKKPKTTKSAPVEAVHYPDKGEVTVTEAYYKELCSDSEELEQLKALLKEAQTENDDKVLAVVRKLVDDPGPTKLKPVHLKDVPAKVNPALGLMIDKLNLSVAMEAALVTNFTYLPRETAVALLSRKLIDKTTDVGDAPYAKTSLGLKVTYYLRKQGKRFDREGYLLR